jgi:phage regulator Rha-like protein
MTFMNETDKNMVPEEVIMSKIYIIRDQKVMLDRDLAELYGVETKQLKRAVRRNIGRFPSDFMFELTKEEFTNWRYQFGTSNREKMGLRIPPFAFTEHGIFMLASVLNSEKAIQMNIQIVRIFSKLRQILYNNEKIVEKLKQVEKSILDHEEKILVIFEYIKQLEIVKQKEQDFKNRKRMGYKT